MRRTTAAIVEDEFVLALELEGLCQDLGCNVLGIARSEAEARTCFGQLRPDVLITDLELGEHLDGVDVAKFLQQNDPSLTVVFITGAHSPEMIQRMKEVSPRNILRKPVRPEELKFVLATLVV